MESGLSERIKTWGAVPLVPGSPVRGQKDDGLEVRSHIVVFRIPDEPDNLIKRFRVTRFRDGNEMSGRSDFLDGVISGRRPR